MLLSMSTSSILSSLFKKVSLAFILMKSSNKVQTWKTVGRFESFKYRKLNFQPGFYFISCLRLIALAKTFNTKWK